MLEAKTTLENILITNNYQANIQALLEIIPELKLITSKPLLWQNTIRALKISPSMPLEIKIAIIFHNLGFKDNIYYPGLASFLAKNTLQRLGYEDEFINEIIYLLQNSHTLIEANTIDPTIGLNLLNMQYALVLSGEPHKIIDSVLKLNAIREQLLMQVPSNLTK